MLYPMLLVLQYPLCNGYTWVKGPSDTPALCPGLYCGRTDRGEKSNISEGRYSECGPCERGWRVYNPSKSSVCQKCEDPPELYDWLYLGFVVLFTLLAHWVAVDFTAKSRRFTKEILILHVSALVEVGVSAVSTLVISQPFGEFSLHSCRVSRLSDWYTLLHNPTPNYEETLHCTQEAVYPLFTMVFIFYSFSLISMLVIRPFLSSKFLPGKGRNAIYAALYFFPIFALIHGVLGGVIYYSYPYIIILSSIVSCAAHYAFKLDQSVKSLVLSSILDTRNLVILLGHWCLHAYGIIAVTELKQLSLHLPLIGLVPVPALFYILTARFTDPARINGGSDIS